MDGLAYVSMAVEAVTTPEKLGDRIRETLPERVVQLESIDVLTETTYTVIWAYR